MGIIWRRICQVLKNKIWKYTGGPGRLATYEAAYAKQQFFAESTLGSHDPIRGSEIRYGNPYAFQSHLIKLKNIEPAEEEAKVEPEHN